MNTRFSRQVTLHFDPAIDEQHAVLQAVARAYAAARSRCSVPAGVLVPPVEDVDGWTAESMYHYVAALEPVARTVLLTMLGSAPCPTDTAQETAELSPRRYAEAHTSLEEALLAVPGAARLPFDVVDGCFTVEAEVAALVLGALDEVDDVERDLVLHARR